jgi:hypothetical protein
MLASKGLLCIHLPSIRRHGFIILAIHILPTKCLSLLLPLLLLLRLPPQTSLLFNLLPTRSIILLPTLLLVPTMSHTPILRPPPVLANSYFFTSNFARAKIPRPTMRSSSWYIHTAPAATGNLHHPPVFHEPVGFKSALSDLFQSVMSTSPASCFGLAWAKVFSGKRLDSLSSYCVVTVGSAWAYMSPLSFSMRNFMLR